MRIVWRTLRTQRNLRLLLGAGLISLTGDWVLRVGLAYHVYVLTGSTLVSSVMLLASFLPQVLLGSLAGVVVDRHDQRRMMIAANLLQAGGLLPLLLVDARGMVWVVYLVMLWQGCVQQFFTPAEQSLVPHLVPDDQLLTANALNGQARDVARLVGSALGGVAVAAGGLTLLTLLDAASFVGSAALLWRMPIRPAGGTPGTRDDRVRQRLRERLAALRTEWVDGLRTTTAERVLRVILVFSVVTTVGEGLMGTLFAPFVHDALDGSGSDYGLIVSVQAVGGIVGGLAAAAVADRVSATSLFGWGAVAFGAIDLVMFLYPLGYVAVWPAVICMILVGVPGAFTLAGCMTLVQRHTGARHRGRVIGALGAVEGLAVVVGTVAAGFLGEAVGIIPVLAGQGAGYLLAGVGVVVALRGHHASDSGRAATESAVG